MTDVRGLCERLRVEFDGWSLDPTYDARIEAATALEQLQAEVERLREERDEAVSRWQGNLRSTTNDYGLFACPKCDSLHDPYPYWWQRGQAWIIICSNCKHEEGREDTEGLARDVWNKAAEQARALQPKEQEAGE